MVSEPYGTPRGRLGGVLGVSGNAWERKGTFDHAGLCLRAGPGLERIGSGSGHYTCLGASENLRTKLSDSLQKQNQDCSLFTENRLLPDTMAG